MSLPRRSAAFASVVLASLAACMDSGAPAAEAMRAPIAVEAGLSASAPRQAERSLVRRATLSLQVLEGEAAAKKSAALARELGGLVADEQTTLRARAERRQLTLRVPVERFDEALARLEALAARVLERRVSVEDVSVQVVDVAARLKTLRTTEQELSELLAQARENGRGLEDVVAVHRELTSIRTQIEQLEGEERRLADQVALATITLELVLEPEAAALASPGWEPLRFAQRCLDLLVRALQVLAEIAMVSIVVVAPVLLLLGAPVWVAWRRRRAA